MDYKRVHIISFLVILLLGVGFAVWMFRPFFTVFAFAAIVAILFTPLHRFFKNRIKNPSLASGATLLSIILIVVLPLLIFGQVLFNEIYGVYQNVKSGELVISQSQILAKLPPQLANVIENFTRDLNSWLTQFTGNAFSALTGFISNVAGFMVSLFLFLFTVFYLLRDGGKIKEVFMDISPISSNKENQLIERIQEAVNGVVKGQFLVALSQGIIGTIGFLIFGLPQPLLWGMFTVIAALVPNIGTSVALIPAVLYLLLTDHTGAAIGLAIWGGIAVGLIDNVLSPTLVASKTKLHPLLVIFSIIGGIQMFGFLGFLLGPILIAVIIALIDMYRSDFKDYLQM